MSTHLPCSADADRTRQQRLGHKDHFWRTVLVEPPHSDDLLGRGGRGVWAGMVGIQQHISFMGVPLHCRPWRPKTSQDRAPCTAPPPRKGLGFVRSQSQICTNVENNVPPTLFRSHLTLHRSPVFWPLLRSCHGYLHIRHSSCQQCHRGATQDDHLS